MSEPMLYHDVLFISSNVRRAPSIWSTGARRGLYLHNDFLSLIFWEKANFEFDIRRTQLCVLQWMTKQWPLCRGDYSVNPITYYYFCCFLGASCQAFFIFDTCLLKGYCKLTTLYLHIKVDSLKVWGVYHRGLSICINR